MATTAIALRSFVNFTKRHPITRGIITYAVLYPSSNLCQQIFQARETIDWKESLRFTIFGAAYVAPTYYVWLKILGKLVPGNSLRVAVTKALVEQVLYSPLGITGFYYGLGFLEGKNVHEATEELKQKFWPTYKAVLVVWPALQTFNFAFVRERNRLIFSGAASFFWTVYMSYMKQLDVKKSELDLKTTSTSIKHLSLNPISS